MRDDLLLWECLRGSVWERERVWFRIRGEEADKRYIYESVLEVRGVRVNE